MSLMEITAPASFEKAGFQDTKVNIATKGMCKPQD